ncbi:MAG TPA: hypothetical protein VG942_17525 [Hyphomonadaceae bacterium]|nr:hypothetical protein [Hyphomonadaceae bacterium]
MPSDNRLNRFKNRRDAERALSEIVEDGGNRNEFRIEEDADGTCVITVLEGDVIAGVLGA